MNIRAVFTFLGRLVLALVFAFFTLLCLAMAVVLIHDGVTERETPTLIFGIACAGFMVLSLIVTLIQTAELLRP